MSYPHAQYSQRYMGAMCRFTQNLSKTAPELALDALCANLANTPRV